MSGPGTFASWWKDLFSSKKQSVQETKKDDETLVFSSADVKVTLARIKKEISETDVSTKKIMKEVSESFENKSGDEAFDTAPGKRLTVAEALKKAGAEMNDLRIDLQALCEKLVAQENNQDTRHILLDGAIRVLDNSYQQLLKQAYDFTQSQGKGAPDSIHDNSRAQVTYLLESMCKEYEKLHSLEAQTVVPGSTNIPKPKP